MEHRLGDWEMREQGRHVLDFGRRRGREGPVGGPGRSMQGQRPVKAAGAGDE